MQYTPQSQAEHLDHSPSTTGCHLATARPEGTAITHKQIANISKHTCEIPNMKFICKSETLTVTFCEELSVSTGSDERMGVINKITTYVILAMPASTHWH